MVFISDLGYTLGLPTNMGINMFRQNDNNLGYFVEKEFKHEFTYRLTTDEWALDHGFKHEIDCGEIRFGNVSKTRAYICSGEDEDGRPDVETWNLSKHVIY